MMLTERIKLELLLLAVLRSDMSLQSMVVIKLGEAKRAYDCNGHGCPLPRRFALRLIRLRLPFLTR